MPPIEAILNLQDMEDLAEKVMSRQGWAYYRSAADAEDCESSEVQNLAVGEGGKGADRASFGGS